MINAAPQELAVSTGLRRPLLLGAAVAASFVVTTVVDPNQPGHYPTCPYLFTTGFYCPGCGTLRAMHALGHGDIGLALHHNPLFVVSAVIGVVLWLAWVQQARRGERLQLAWPRWIQIALPTLVAAYWILRNVPGFEFLGPT